MSMRDKSERDLLRESVNNSPKTWVNLVVDKSCLSELLDMAEERDEMAIAMDEYIALKEQAEAKCRHFEAKLALDDSRKQIAAEQTMIEGLRTNLSHVHGRLLDEIMRRQQLEAELERLRKTAPEDIYNLVNKVTEEQIKYRQGLIPINECISGLELKNMIGALVERRREEILEAGRDGWRQSDAVWSADSGARDYANKIIGGKG